MKKSLLSLMMLTMSLTSFAQINPVIAKMTEQLKGLHSNVTTHYSVAPSTQITDCIVSYHLYEETDDSLFYTNKDGKKIMLNAQADSTCRGLWKKNDATHRAVMEAIESLSGQAVDKYRYETHRNNQDTIFITMALRSDDENKTPEVNDYQHMRYYIDAPEYIQFRMVPIPNAQKYLSPSWSVHFSYYSNTPYVYVEKGKKEADAKEYTKLIQKALNQKGVEKWNFTETIDSTFVLDRTKAENIPYMYNQKFYSFHKRHNSSTQGTIYKVTSQEQAQQFCDLLVETSKEYVDLHAVDNQNWSYEIVDQADLVSNRGGYKIFQLSEVSNGSLTNSINLVFTKTMNPECYYFGIFSSMGDLLLPQDWMHLKSWDNGTKVYQEKEFEKK